MTHAVRTGPRMLLVLGGLFPPLLLVGLAVISSGLAAHSGIANAVAEEATERATAKRLFTAGNFNESYKVYRQLALQPGTSAAEVDGDLKQAIVCLGRLARTPEVDALRDKVVSIHRRNWRLLLAAAQTLADGPHNGQVVAGEYQRGGSRGIRRGRVRARFVSSLYFVDIDRADCQLRNVPTSEFRAV